MSLNDAHINCKDVQKMISDRFQSIINGSGIVVPRVAVKIAVDDLIAELNGINDEIKPCSFCNGKVAMDPCPICGE